MQANEINERTLLAVGMVLAAGPGFTMFNAVPVFADVFRSLGSLPLVTSLAVRFYPVLWALPLLVLVVWLTWPRKDKRGLAAFVSGAASLVLVPLLLASMYLPIVSLGR